MKGDLANWLAKELRERGWTVSYVARIGGISTAMVNGILGERRGPGAKTYQALSTVFNVPMAMLQQLAGVVVYAQGGNRRADEVIAMVPMLDEEQLDHAHYMISSMLKAKSIERNTEIATGVSPEMSRSNDKAQQVAY
jgi:transcriptional regulator with XRE-family HTH domain